MEKIPVNRPKRSFFNLSHIKSFTADAGRLIPICCEEVVPGDKFVIDQALLVRLNPTVTPFMTDLTAYVHYFFVPYRILDKRWEEFITGGDNGDSDVSLPLFRTREEEKSSDNEWIPELRSFHDYLSLPLEALNSDNAPLAYPYLAHCSIFDHYYRDENLMEPLSDSHPFEAPLPRDPKEEKRYYCDVFSKAPGSLFFDFIKSMDDVSKNDIFSVGWKKDYFVGALPSTQRGPGAVFPQNNLPLEPNLLRVTNNVRLIGSNLTFGVGGLMTTYPTPDGTTIRFNFDIPVISLDNKQYQSGGVYYVNNSPGTVFNAVLNDGNADSNVLVSDPRFVITANSANDISVTFFVTYSPSVGVKKEYGFLFSNESTHFEFSGNTINLQNISGSNVRGDSYPATPAFANSTGNAVTIRDLRVAWQLQLFLERSNVVGNRYSELIRGHFGINPRDSRLQRPEYIGGIKFPVSVSEVTQTSESNITPQGHLTGKGLSTEYSRIGKYFATEYGLIMGYLSILPRASYCQGVPRWLLRRSRFDFYFPEFAHVGDQEIYNAELYATKDSESVARKPFGFRGRFDELRSIPDKVCADFRPGKSLASWTLCRFFNSLPVLNKNFIKSTVPSSSGGIAMDRVLMVPSEPAFNIQVGNIIKAYRPLPVFATPGYVDHPFINSK